jgi:hypothetical protein
LKGDGNDRLVQFIQPIAIGCVPTRAALAQSLHLTPGMSLDTMQSPHATPPPHTRAMNSNDGLFDISRQTARYQPCLAQRMALQGSAARAACGAWILCCTPVIYLDLRVISSIVLSCSFTHKLTTKMTRIPVVLINPRIAQDTFPGHMHIFQNKLFRAFSKSKFKGLSFSSS